MHAPAAHSLTPAGEEAGFGLESLLEVLGFVVDTLATPQGLGGHSDLHIFGLELMHAAIQAGGAGAASASQQAARGWAVRAGCPARVPGLE